MDDKAKEAFGGLTGDEAKKEEGRARQRKAAVEEEAGPAEAQGQRSAGRRHGLIVRA